MIAQPAERSLGVYELKTHLSSVLDDVLAGMIVTVTRHGHPIARITPVSASSAEARRAAVDQLKAARAGRTLGMSMREAVIEGRR
jgi:prevent-host-death family protein